MRAIGLIAAALGFLVLPWLASAQAPVRDGNWEITTRMDMPGMAGMPMVMPPVTTKQCITKEQASDPKAALPKAGDHTGGGCTVGDYKVVGNKVTWTMKCDGEMKMTGNGEITYVGSSFEGWLKLTHQDGGEMTMKYSATRLGDCTK